MENKVREQNNFIGPETQDHLVLHTTEVKPGERVVTKSINPRKYQDIFKIVTKKTKTRFTVTLKLSQA